MKIELKDLLPATVKDETPTPKERERKGRDIRVHRAQAKARLIAQEYVRNGMDFISAYNTVCHTRYVKNSMTVYRLLGKTTDTFIAELNRLLERADIDREKALGILWAMVNTSILDFMDEHGNLLPVAEMKKLPRVMQVILSEIEVHSKQVIANGPDGKPLLNDMGVPYVLTVSHVKIKVPEKLAAMRQLAEIMRWVGPSVQVNNFNIGALMSEADSRRKTLDKVYEGDFTELPK